MKGINYTSEKEGFTLIEVMVAMAIFTIGALALIGLQLKSLESAAKARRLETATQLVQYPIEMWKGVSFTEFDRVYSCYASSLSLAAGKTYITDNAPSYTASNSTLMLQKVAKGWRAMFERTSTVGYRNPRRSDPYFQSFKTGVPRMVRGVMIIQIERKTVTVGTVTVTFNYSATVTSRIYWCDDMLVTDAKCALVVDANGKPTLKKKQHYVQSKMKFINNM